MSKGKHSQRLDLSRLDVRAGNVLRRLGVDTIEKLLAVTQQDMTAMRNCGSLTIAKILRLQDEYGKGPSFIKYQQETIDKAISTSRADMNRVLGVAIAAGEVVAGAKPDGRYHCRVSKQRYNMLRRALEALRKQQGGYGVS